MDIRSSASPDSRLQSACVHLSRGESRPVRSRPSLLSRRRRAAAPGGGVSRHRSTQVLFYPQSNSRWLTERSGLYPTQTRHTRDRDRTPTRQRTRNCKTLHVTSELESGKGKGRPLQGARPRAAPLCAVKECRSSSLPQETQSVEARGSAADDRALNSYWKHGTASPTPGCESSTEH